jgi:zinc transporter ZupT
MLDHIPNILLALITVLGGAVPLVSRPLNDRNMNLLLAFSGSFLLGITCLHLLPETFSEIPQSAGVNLIIGFFLQLIIQRLTHGVEHGHAHIHEHGHHVNVMPILLGLSIHAFMEGIPLGFHYRNAGTNPSLYLAVGAHKIPEAMIIGMLLKHSYGRRTTWYLLMLFALVTPASASLATWLGGEYLALSNAVTAIIPIVAGAFIHISTTIFYESGTRHHMLTIQKAGAMLLGVSLAALTLAFE